MLRRNRLEGRRDWKEEEIGRRKRLEGGRNRKLDWKKEEI